MKLRTKERGTKIEKCPWSAQGPCGIHHHGRGGSAWIIRIHGPSRMDYSAELCPHFPTRAVAVEAVRERKANEIRRAV